MIISKALGVFLVSALTLSACSHNGAVVSDTPAETDTTPAVVETETPTEPTTPTASTADYLNESPKFTTYSAASYDELKGEKQFALFFHAEWCPTCKLMEKNINAELSSFPKGTKILQANYDTETDLKREYGITSQSIVLVFDVEGNAIKTLAAPDNATLISAIKSSL